MDGGLSILNDQHMASGFNLILKSDFRDFKEEYNKPKTIFLAHVRNTHWVCFSNIFMSNTIKFKDNGNVIYDERTFFRRVSSFKTFLIKKCKISKT